MISEQPVVNLRPMSIGEMLDRAITVYFKNVLVLTATLGVVLVPMLFLSYLSQRDLIGFDLSMFTAAMKNPNAPPPQPDVNQMSSAYLSSIPYMGLTLLLMMFALPFANAAVIAGVSRSYLGQPVRFVECYRDALSRWANILILGVLWMVAIIVAYFVFVILVLILALVGVALGAALVPKGNAGSGVGFAIMAMLLGIPTVLWILGSAMQTYLAWALSFAAVIIEHADPIKAFGSGFSRVFGGGAYWRSFGLAAAVFGIVMVFELIAAGAVAAAFHVLKLSIDSVPAAFSAWNGLVTAVITPVTFAVVAMYYYDARIRREGFDLELLARQLSGGAPAQPTSPA